ncbi:hypothetical protein vBVpPvVp04M_00028 [Vibrio phage vB_Vp_PvVp04_M]|nr:hypothetical protein vBVpPvVp04M_00028 [Vibrio phage vB_Vp_PvVp04_M]
MSLVGKYGDWEVVNRMSVDDVLDALEFESISSDIQAYKMEQAKGG